MSQYSRDVRQHFFFTYATFSEIFPIDVCYRLHGDGRRILGAASAEMEKVVLHSGGTPGTPFLGSPGAFLLMRSTSPIPCFDCTNVDCFAGFLTGLIEKAQGPDPGTEGFIEDSEAPKCRLSLSEYTSNNRERSSHNQRKKL